MQRFTNKTALITGAGRGIGRGIALCLAAEGANIVVNDRTLSDDAQVVADEIVALGCQALICPADVAERTALERMFAAAIERFGRIDVVVANAAHSVRQPVLEADWETVKRTIDVTQLGVFHTCQLAAQHMVKQPCLGRSRGKIVIISSVHEEMAFALSAAYNMAKAAVNHLARTMAIELAPHRINVNVINPGWIDTPGERNYFSEEQIREGGKRIPWGRIGLPEDIGKAVSFLASDDAEYVTGSVLRVDGGLMVGLSIPE